MELLADTHVHVYPAHNAGALIRQATDRLRRYAASPAPVLALLLTEGKGHHFFASLKRGDHGLPDTMTVEACAEPEAVRVRWADQDVWVMAGRQIVTAERVEILALTLLDEWPDGQPVATVIEQVNAAGAVPVLAWAPGKWMFKRAHVVDELVARFPAGKLLLGDSSLRARGWPEPSVMRDAARPVLAGSDPLPFPGDETQTGGYGIRADMDFDEAHPVSSVRAWLRDPAARVERVGQRNSPVTMLARMLKHRRSKRA